MKTRLLTFFRIICVFSISLWTIQALRGDLVISGIIDGDLPDGHPKGIEVFVTADIPDLSIYGIGSANNGQGTDGEEFTFPAEPATQGDYLTIEASSGTWEQVFGEPADFFSGVVSINGDDAIELFKNGEVLDVFGEIDVIGDGTVWEYTDSYAYRVNRNGPDGEVFMAEHWIFGGPGALDGKDAAQQGEIVKSIFGSYLAEGEDPLALSLSADTTSFPEDAPDPSATVTVSLNRDSETAVIVHLSADDDSEFILPASVELAAGVTSVAFTVVAIDDGELDADQVVTITAEADGVVGATLVLTVTDIADAPLIVINEIYPNTTSADPNNDGISSFDDEYVEVVNGTESEVDLAGWSLYTFGNNVEPTRRHVFPAGTLLAQGAAVVVFQSIDVSRVGAVDYGGAAVQSASSGTLFLADASDIVSLRDPEGRPVSVVEYRDNTLQAASLNRSPEITGEAFVAHYEIEESQGFSFSPGTRVSGVAFAGGESSLGLTIEDKQLIEPNPAAEQEFTLGIVRRSSPSGFSAPLVVHLASSDPGEAVPVPQEITIPAGEVFAGFEIVSVEDHERDGDKTNIVITAVAEGYTSAEDSVDVLDAQTDTILLEATPAKISEDGGIAEVTLRLLSIELADFLRVPEDFVIALSADDLSEVVLPEEVVVPKDDFQVTFEVRGVPDDEPENGDQFVTIRASAEGFRVLPIQLVVTNVDAAAWVINEILADPAAELGGDANGDGTRDSSEDEFVELVNNHESVQDISGWTLADATANRHVFPDGTVLQPGAAIVVFGGGAPTGSFGGTVVQVASTGSLGLNNDGDTLTLFDSTGNVILVQEYGEEGGQDQSLVRFPDLIGELTGLHSELEGSGGLPYSPGTKLDGAPFTEPVMTDPLDVWRIAQFGEHAADSEISGDVKDPDRDGLPNLFEYAFGLDPNQPDFDGKRFPQVIAGDSLRVAFDAPSATAEGITLAYQFSTNLSEWAPLSGEAFTLDTVSDGDFTHYILTLNQAVAGTPTYFFRVVIELDE